MKKCIFLFVLVLFVAFSCQTNDDSEIIETNSDITETRGFDLTVPPTQAEIFENDLEWLSFLVAETILFDVNAKAQFLSLLGNDYVNDVIDIHDLLGNNNLNTSFKDAFEERYDYFMNMPSGCEHCPDGRLHPPTGATCQGVCGFLKIILEYNCVELYLPNGFNPSINEIGSTAHPISDSNYNDGYKHYSSQVVFEAFSILNINSINNPIVARPYINVLDANCDYSTIYHISDFTLFLDN